LRTGGREVDIRVSVIPMIHGEGLVLRLLDKSAMEFSLSPSGMENELYAKFQELIRLPHGIILVTDRPARERAPRCTARCWKSRATRPRSSPPKNPVEYQLEGINPDSGASENRLTFRQFAAKHSAARPRHHPCGRNPRPGDGGKRHPGIADGHLVFSTSTTNDAAGAYTRLIDMGLEPF